MEPNEIAILDRHHGGTQESYLGSLAERLLEERERYMEVRETLLAKMGPNEIAILDHHFSFLLHQSR
jgi:hypothetical protein